MARVPTRRGEVYLAGLDQPLLAPWGTIAAGLRERGLELLAHTARDEPPLAFDVQQASPFYSDGWDTVVLVRVLHGGTVELPDRVKWFVRAPTLGVNVAPPPDVEQANPDAVRGAAAGAAASQASAEATARARNKGALAAAGAAAILVTVIVLARRKRR